MDKIYSKINPEVLLHIVVRKEDFIEGRQEIIDVNQFLQCCTLNLKKGHTFKPHKHKWKNVDYRTVAQESWVVIKGSVQCIFYDIDDNIISQPILNEGDASFTLLGGHNYLILEDDTKVLEYKTGPYFGQAIDKEFI